MGGQHQGILVHGVAQGAQRVGEGGDRVVLRVERAHRQVAGDFRQHLVAADQHLVALAVEADVLRGVAAADVHPPGVAVDGDGVAGGQGFRLRRQFRQNLAEGVAAPGQGVQVVTGHAVAAEEGAEVVADFPVAGRMQLGGERPLAPGHPHRGLEVPRQPAGLTDVVRVVVGDDDTVDGPPAQGILEGGAPDFLGVTGREAGVHQGPAVAVLEQPQIDVVEGERQRKVQPMHAGGHFPALAGFRGLIERVPKRVGHNKTSVAGRRECKRGKSKTTTRSSWRP